MAPTNDSSEEDKDSFYEQLNDIRERDSAVVRTLAFHPKGPGFDPSARQDFSSVIHTLSSSPS